MKKAFFTAASILALSATPSFAQTAKISAPKAAEKAVENKSAPVAESNVFKLGQISVSVADQQTVVGSRNVVTQEEIQAYDDSDTLDSAIALLPGVDVTQVGRKNETSVSIRGFDMRQIVLMQDGIPVYMPYDSYPDLARVLTGDLSEIQVSKGLGSVLTGPNTMGGVINMVSKRPAKKMEGDFSVRAMMADSGAFNGFRSKLNIGTNQGLYYVQAGAAYDDSERWSLSDGYRPVVSQNGTINQRPGQRDNSESKDKKFNIKFGLTPNETDEYSISYIYQSGSAGIPPYAGYSYVGGDENALTGQLTRPQINKPAAQLTKPFWRDYPYWDKQSLYTLTNTALGETGYVKTRLFYDTFKNRMDGTWRYPDKSSGYVTDVIDTDRGFPSFYDDYALGGSAEAGADLIPMNTTKIAFHYRRDHHEEQKFDAAYIPDFSPVEKSIDDTYSVALENTFHATDRLDVILGASYDWLDVKQADGENADGNPFVNHNDQSLNPMMAMRYRYSDTGTVYGGVAQKSRFATQKSRYSYKADTAVPNPDLKAEHTVNWELGMTETFAQRFHVDAAAFYSAVRDTNLQVLLTQGPYAGKYQTQNFGRSHSWGFEIGSYANITNDFDLGLAYTYLRKELDDAYAADGTRLKPIDAPRHKLTLYANWRPVEEISIIPTLEAYSSRYSTIGGNNAIGGAVKTTGTFADGLDGVKVGGFMTAGLKVAYKPVKDYEVALGVANIFDKNYELADGYPMQGRNYYLTLTTKF